MSASAAGVVTAVRVTGTVAASHDGAGVGSVIDEGSVTGSGVGATSVASTQRSMSTGLKLRTTVSKGT